MTIAAGRRQSQLLFARKAIAIESSRAIIKMIVLMSETCLVARASGIAADRAAARRQVQVGVRARNSVAAFLVTMLLLWQATLAVSGRYTKRQVDDAVAAEEPANGANTSGAETFVTLSLQAPASET